MEKELKILYEPFQLKGLELKNRLVMAPMHTKFASESGEVTERLIAFLEERARGGVGLIVLENTCIDWLYGRAAGNPVSIHDDLCRSGLSNIALTVHRHGVKIVTQLHQTGRQNLRSNIGGGLQPVAPSVVKSKHGGDEPRALEEAEIEKIIQQYVDGARRTKDAGFDGVELHGAHGYLLTQFFSPYTNRRTDKWGGSLQNRARFPVEVVRRIRAQVGKEYPILYRLSAEERIPGGTTLEDTLKLVRMLEEVGVDCFDITAGIYDSIEWIYTLQGVAPGSLIPLAEAVKKVTSKPVIGVSRLGWDLKYAAQVVREGRVDLVALGRSLLADAYLPKKYQLGKPEEIAPCIACNECIAMEDRGWQLHCVINPLLSSEYLNPVKPAAVPKKVLVVGGGPAGMQCAFTAAARGHRVTLVEKAERLGGQLLAAGTAAYKSKEMGAFLSYLSTMLEKHKVEVRLGTEVKGPESLKEKPEVVVLALGAVPKCPEFAGSENVPTAFDVLMNKAKGIGKRVVVIGSSGVGIDVALYLSETEGRQVTVVEMEEEIGGDLNEFLKPHTLGMAEQKGIKFLPNWRVTQAGAKSVKAQTLYGEQQLECDSVVAACGFQPRASAALREAFERQGVEVYVVGSAVEAGLIFDATQSGFWTGVEI
jgi:2,4-dienoyl-CoA reductase-like NADH-dependent reductase (Old Yellow Enzyme family)/thioredoxin reductase